MNKIKQLVTSYFRKTPHDHIVTVDDMALGIARNGGVPVTAWKYRCRLCGKNFIDITNEGWCQIQDGEENYKVFQWMNDCDRLRGLPKG